MSIDKLIFKGFTVYRGVLISGNRGVSLCVLISGG